MANLLITTNCQRKCSYCFAKGDRDKGMLITWEYFIQALKFIATGPKALNLLGGEPTMHPDFDKMLSYLLENDFLVQVFTNGMVKQDLLDKITSILNRISLRRDQLFFAVNVNEEKYRTEEEDRLQKRFLNSMGHLAYLSFTIHEETDLSFLQNMIKEYKLDPTIRLGLAMPIYGENNKSLPVELYRGTARRILDLTNNSEGTTITLDCGFPMCMFKLEELKELIKNEENQFSFICGTPLDIYPDLALTNCYPLSKTYKENIARFDDVMDAYKFFSEKISTSNGIFGRRCEECQFFNELCMGGCRGLDIIENS
jgi:MoaA/NifB/PqqE/SkfB family radical SAM enzyme